MVEGLALLLDHVGLADDCSFHRAYAYFKQVFQQFAVLSRGKMSSLGGI